MNIRESFGLSPMQRHGHSLEFICGVEFEVEDIKGFGDIGHNANFICEEDHSLRGSAKEFKTLPSTYEETLGLFTQLYKSISVGKDAFNERTSTHVHVNVRELTDVQVRELVLTYALLEPLFFHFVGETRKNSIFCVPLNYTYLPSHYKRNLVEMLSKWHKYTAFNLAPISSFGTVEFRHLFGTNDPKVFKEWLTTLKELFEFIRDTPDFSLLGVIAEGCESADIAKVAVPTLCKGLSNTQINVMLEDSLLDVKLSVGGLK
jgi:hypothetical protein